MKKQQHDYLGKSRIISQMRHNLGREHVFFFGYFPEKTGRHPGYGGTGLVFRFVYTLAHFCLRTFLSKLSACALDSPQKNY